MSVAPVGADPDDLGAVVGWLRDLPPAGLAKWLRTGLTGDELGHLVAALPHDRRAALAAAAAPARRLRPAPQQARDATSPTAAALRAARQRTGLSQAELAELLGVRQSSVSQWERGLTVPSGPHLVRLLGELPALAALLASGTAGAVGGPDRPAQGY